MVNILTYFKLRTIYMNQSPVGFRHVLEMVYVRIKTDRLKRSGGGILKLNNTRLLQLWPTSLQNKLQLVHSYCKSQHVLHFLTVAVYSDADVVCSKDRTLFLCVRVCVCVVALSAATLMGSFVFLPVMQYLSSLLI